MDFTPLVSFLNTYFLDKVVDGAQYLEGLGAKYLIVHLESTVSLFIEFNDRDRDVNSY